jgi:hypothetical protein
MTKLEERVRDALRARAGEFTASPDAWERTTARAGRRVIRRQAGHPRRQRWLTQLTPLAAAAAVLVIGAGTATVAGSGGLNGAVRPLGLGRSENTAPKATLKTASSSGPSLAGSGGSQCAFPGSPPKVPVTGVPISAKVTLDGVTTWWTRVPESVYSVVDQSHPKETHLALCQIRRDGNVGGYVFPLGKGQLVQAVAGGSRGSSVSGIAAASVTSVEADLANGQVVRGSVAYGHGFPYAAWWVSYPLGDPATLVFRNAAGQQVAVLHEQANP